MAADTWFTRDLPVLEAAAELIDEQMLPVQPQEISRQLGMDLEDVSRALVALDGPYIEMRWLQRRAGIGRVMSVTPAARREIGQWPTPEAAADRMVQAIESRIETTDSEEERGRLVRARDALLGVGRDLFVDVMGAVVSRQVTGG
jgi:hypothetical protein